MNYTHDRLKLIQGDCLEVLKGIESESCDYALTSPPYFFLMDYKKDGQYGLESTVEAYLETQVKVFAEIYRILKEGCFLSIVIGDTSNNYSPARGKGDRRVKGAYEHRRPLQPGYKEKEALHVPAKLRDALKAWGWQVLPDLIWDKGSSDRECMLGYATHESILMLMKDTKNRRLKPAYLEPFKSSVLRHKPIGDDVHPCPYPLGLAAELIDHLCLPGGVVIDPYIGSGTTAIAAHRLKRQCVGIDLDISRAVEKIEQETQQLNLLNLLSVG